MGRSLRLASPGTTFQPPAMEVVKCLSAVAEMSPREYLISLNSYQVKEELKFLLLAKPNATPREGRF